MGFEPTTVDDLYTALPTELLEPLCIHIDPKMSPPFYIILVFLRKLCHFEWKMHTTTPKGNIALISL